MSAFAICVVAVFYIARVSGASTNGFSSLEQLSDDELARQLVSEPVRQWLFPAIRFTCDGYVTKWIFRARNQTTGGIDNSDRPPFLPLMQTFEELTGSMIGPSIDYRLKSTTGSEQELQGSGPVYEYVLQSPVEVQENDIFGIETLFPGETDGTWRLRLEMLEVADGRTAPTSFPKAFPAEVFDTDFNIIPTNNNLIPLVTAMISIPRGGGTTSLVFPQPTPIPAASSRMSLSATPPSQTTVQASGTAPGPVQTPTIPQPTGPPGPVQTPTTPQPTGPPGPVQTPTTSRPTGPPDESPATPPDGSSGGSNMAAAIIGTVVAFLLVAAIVILITIIVLIMRYSMHHKAYGPKTKEPTLENPMYQGVVSGDENKTQTTRSSSSNGSYHIYAMPGQITPHPQETLVISTIGSRYEDTEAASSTLDSYYELETSSHKYDQPSVSTTLASQYEVPVPSPKPSGEERQKGHVYSELECGIFVLTEEERKTLTGTTDGTAFDDSIYARWSKRHHSRLQDGKFFEEEDIYWKPATTKRGLYDQLAKKKYREILKHQIQIIEHLGAGQFGTVNKGLWQSPEGTMEVAVKTLQPSASDNDRVKFLQEAAIMGQFLHPNVVKLYGVVTVGEPIMIVLEYLQKGDLREYLKGKRPQPGEMVPSDLPQCLLGFCCQIASGMNYLSNKAFVHRDLAARNVLVAADNTCKIADFGMSRDLENNNYYITHGGKIPVKWTAPEALNFRKHSSASDVWSFGTVMFEIWSLGHKPFEGFTNQQAMQLISSGFRLAPPPGCSRPLYGLMIRCWHTEAVRRPTFSAIVKMLAHSDSHLLSWTDKDKSVHLQAACLGGPLEAGENLYPELQDYYTDENSKML